MNQTDPPAAEAEPICKFEQGCHRVVACDPGCGAAPAVFPEPPSRAAGQDEVDRLAEWLWDNCAEDERSGLLADDPRRIATVALHWPELRRVADEAQQQEPDARPGELKPWQLLGDVEGPVPQTERVIGGRRLTPEAQQQPETEALRAAGFVNPQTGTGYATGGNWTARQPPEAEAGPWVVQKICCGHNDGKTEFATWEAADSFREVYIDSARIADHERSAVIRRADAPAPVEPAAADSEETRS